MTALSAGRTTPERDGAQFSFPVAATTTIYQGGIVALNTSGYATPGAATATLAVVGMAAADANNASGGNGDISVPVKAGVFRFGNSSSSDEITRAQIGDTCFVVDDQTVAKTNGSSTRPPAGIIVDVDSSGVWVRLGWAVMTASGLVAANNLSDVSTPATARANIGSNKLYLHIDVATLVGTGVYRSVAPVAGTISKIWSITEGALTTGDATLTAKIGASAVTNGVITITQAGSAAGDVDSATPTAANTVAAGDGVSVTVGGTNATASAARVLVEITY